MPSMRKKFVNKSGRPKQRPNGRVIKLTGLNPAFRVR